MSLWNDGDYATKKSENWLRVKVQLVNFMMDDDEKDLVYNVLAVLIDYADGLKSIFNLDRS